MGPHPRPLALLDPQGGRLTLLGDGASWNRDWTGLGGSTGLSFHKTLSVEDAPQPSSPQPVLVPPWAQVPPGQKSP